MNLSSISTSASTVAPSDSFLRELPTHSSRLWRFALRLTRNTHDAEDLLQRSYLRGLERRHQWQPATSMISWLFAIMHSIWVNELRSAQRRRTGSLESEEQWDEIPDRSTNNDPEHILFYKQVVNSVDALPEAQRVVMVLIAVEGLSYREAADVLDIPIGTVMSRLARARIAVGEQFVTSVQISSASQINITKTNNKAST